jgi:hypothetical protein
LMKHYELKDIIQAIKEEIGGDDSRNNADTDGYRDTLCDSDHSGFEEGNK